MAKYKSRHKGSEIDNAVDKVKNLAAVATSGSYNDLTDKPDGGADITVDSALSTSSTNPVQNKVVTAELNKKGTYSKPSTGIPKSDLANDVQESLGKADTALQSFEERYKGTVTKVKINGSTKNPDADGLVDLGNIEGGEGGSVIVDEALSDTSTNPVQNKAVAEAVNQKFDKTGGVIEGFMRVAGEFVADGVRSNNWNPSDIDSLKFPFGLEVQAIASYLSSIPEYSIDVGSILETLKWDLNAANQMYYSTGTNNVFYRSRWGGEWRSWREFAFLDSNGASPSSGTYTINGSAKANDYLDAYGISLYETFATKTELEEALQGGGGNEVVSIKLTLNGSNTTTNINGAKVVVNNISKGTTATYSWAGNDITATVPAGDTFSVVCHACNSYAPPAEFSSVAIKGNNRIVSLNYITAPTGVYFCSNTGALTGSKDGNTVGIYVGSSSLKRVITPNKYLGYITGSTVSGSTNNSNGRVPTNNCTPDIVFGDIDYDPWLPSVVKGVSLLGKKCYIPASDEYSMLGSNKDAVTSYIAQFGNVYDHEKQAHFSSGFLYYGSTGPNAYYDEPIYAYSFGMVEY